MRTRTLSREAALQYLYEVDIVGLDQAEDLDEFVARQLGRAEARAYAAGLARGVLARREEIDGLLKGASDNWALERMAVVDRNVLRLGVYELLYTGDIPPGVAINEAINLARRFSSEDACAFVNGILDRIHESAPRPDAMPDDGQEGGGE